MRKRKEKAAGEGRAALDVRERAKLQKRSKKGLSSEETAQIVSGTCEQLLDLGLQMNNAKLEYEAVTSYLTDIQLIERMELSSRQKVSAAAGNIMRLSQERFSFRKQEDRMPIEQYLAMERFEKEIPQEMKNLYEQEQYYRMIQSDMRQLEGERGVIRYAREEAEDKKIFLQRLALGSCVAAVLLFLSLLLAGAATETDMTMPLLLLAALSAVAAAYITLTVLRCDQIIRESEVKMNRVIQLTNKIKIKLVNSTNALEYSCSKYQVGSYQELSRCWEEYMQIREEDKRYRRNTEMLEQYNRQLVAALRAEGVKDAEIWIYQTDALINEKEMVELRHQLNTRRQKLRERLEYNQKQEEFSKNELKELLEHSGDNRELAEKIISQYGITT